ncbi:MAG: glycosyltransferase [Acidimicrobiia bacterium]
MTGAGRTGDVRVAFFGNVANCLFQVARALRGCPGIDAHLFVGRTDSLFGRPESADPRLADGYPDWIHEGEWITPASVAAPWLAPITRHLRDFDVVVVSGPGPIFAQWAGRPWCWFVSGGDLTVKPFPLTFLSWYSGLPHKLGEVVGGAWQRRAARRADRLWVQPFAPMADGLRRLRVPSASISPRYLPLVVDTDVLRPDRPIADPEDPVVRRMLAAGLAVLHPSRLIMRDDPRLRRTGQWKGNDILIRGFAELVKAGEVRNPLLVMPAMGLSRDLAAGRALVSALGIDDQVVWAEPPHRDAFPRHKLLDFYLAADVVASDFGVGWFGYVTLEGLAAGKPVLSHIDDVAMAKLYPDGHPICEAADPQAVCERLLQLWREPAAAARIGQLGRQWVVAHHAPEAAGARYVDAVTELVAELAAR